MELTPKLLLQEPPITCAKKAAFWATTDGDGGTVPLGEGLLVRAKKRAASEATASKLRASASLWCSSSEDESLSTLSEDLQGEGLVLGPDQVLRRGNKSTDAPINKHELSEEKNLKLFPNTARLILSDIKKMSDNVLR